MANEFSKEEKVAFEDILLGFEDGMVLSKMVRVFRPADTEMVRADNVYRRPMPYIAQSFDGTDQTSNFKEATQLTVPSTYGYRKSVPWIMTADDLRDSLQEKRLGDSAKQRLSSDINTAVMDALALQGSLVIKRTNVASGFDDIAIADSVMNEIGINNFDRSVALSSRDYNSMASDLAKRSTMAGKPTTAYEKALVGQISGFETVKMDSGRRLSAAVATGATIAAANQYYTPKATSTAATGEKGNVDNRFQIITVAKTGGGNFQVGDCFTVAGVNSVHLITKQDTGQLKTFRITKIVTGGGGNGTVEITPPFISAQGATDAEKVYKNVTATPANGAAITFLNTVTAAVNPFWQKDAVEIITGSYGVPSNAGVAVMRASTSQGLELVFQKWYDINTMKIKYRMDTLFGVTVLNTEMSGIILFSQT